MKLRITISTEFRYPRMPIKKGEQRTIEIEVPPAQAAEILAARETLPDYVGMEHLLTTVDLINDDGLIISRDERVHAQS